MIRSTFLKELKELSRDGRVRISFLIVVLLMAVATWISKSQYTTINEQYKEAETAERHIWEGQGEKNPHSAAHYGTYAFKPKYPLSLVDHGVDKFTGTSIFLEAHKRNEAQFSKAADQTGLARFGDLTPDFVLLFILPLLIVFLGYNAFTKEKEMGTLVLLKSQGTPVWKLIFGKWLAIFTPIFLVVALLFMVAGIVLSNLKDFGVFSWESLGVMFLVYMVYYMIFINLVLFISSKMKKSGISLVLSLGVWILACLAVPKAASNMAESQYPYPTRQEFAASITKDQKSGIDGHDPWNKQAKMLEDEVLKQHNVDSLEQLPFNFDAYRMQKGEEHTAEIYFKHYKHLKTQFEQQSKLYRNLAVLSPFLPARFMSMAIANTDYATHWDFADAAETYRVDLQAFLNGNFAENSSYGEWSYRADESTWKEMPVFDYDPPELSETLSRNSSNSAILSVWILGSFSLLFLTTKKL
ncbi:MAG: ABC transporter permease [Allomuricauda sp.]